MYNDGITTLIMQTPSVFVIILNYDGGDAVIACANSVFHSRGIVPHVVIVDNASTDQSLERLRQRFPRATYIRNDTNIGFAAGNNVGIRFALERGATHVVLVNNDAVLAPDAIAELVAAANTTPSPAALCPIITTPGGRTWYAGARIDWLRMRVRHVRLVPRNCRKQVVPVPVLTGCVLCIHRDVFRLAGLLNESYFLYYEDADFSVCARAAGCTVGVAPRARAVHAEASAAPQRREAKTYWLVLSALLFFRAHAPLPYQALYLLLLPLRRLKATVDRISGIRGATTVTRAFHDAAQARRHYVRHR